MDTLLYCVGLTLVKSIQALPLRWVARIGRTAGALAYILDARHRNVAKRNLAMCFGEELSAAEISALAKENFRRLGENYCCAVKTASMSWDQLKPFVTITGTEDLFPPQSTCAPASIVVAIGHFGNFELYARFSNLSPHCKIATTYRGFSPPSMNKLWQSLRAQSGCTYFERRTQAAELKAWMKPVGTSLGLLADQHAGVGGIRIPFLGHDCSTTTSPAVFALRYHCPLYTAICYRTRLGHWRIDMGDEIPTHEGEKARTIESLTRDVNRAFEAAVRKDPANWFWVHNRWKPNKPSRRRRLKAVNPESAVKE